MKALVVHGGRLRLVGHDAQGDPSLASCIPQNGHSVREWSAGAAARGGGDEARHAAVQPAAAMVGCIDAHGCSRRLTAARARMPAVESLSSDARRPWRGRVQLRRVDAQGSQQVSIGHAGPLSSASVAVGSCCHE
jgi:hypothetical protein